MIISAREAKNLAMKDMLETKGFKENLDNYLSSISNVIEKEAKNGFLHTTYELNGIHRFFDCSVEYFETLCLVIIEHLTRLGYETEHYENPCGHWLKISWYKTV